MGTFLQAVLIAVIAASSGAITAYANARIDSKRKKREKDDSTKQILNKLEELETKINGLQKRLEGLEKAQCITMQERIKRLAIKYCEKGEISYPDYETLKKMHQIYHYDLNGNGFLDDLMKDVEELPRVS